MQLRKGASLRSVSSERLFGAFRSCLPEAKNLQRREGREGGGEGGGAGVAKLIPAAAVRGFVEGW